MPGLVLQRKVGQRIVIGGNIFITVARVEAIKDREQKVWLQVEAPPHFIVDREEVHESRKSSKQ